MYKSIEIFIYQRLSHENSVKNKIGELVGQNRSTNELKELIFSLTYLKRVKETLNENIN